MKEKLHITTVTYKMKLLFAYGVDFTTTSLTIDGRMIKERPDQKVRTAR